MRYLITADVEDADRSDVYLHGSIVEAVRDMVDLRSNRTGYSVEVYGDDGATPSHRGFIAPLGDEREPLVVLARLEVEYPDDGGAPTVPFFWSADEDEDTVLVQDLTTGRVTREEPLWQYDVRTQTGRGVEHREWLSAGEVRAFLAARFPEDIVDSTWQHLEQDGEVASTVVGYGDLWVERYSEIATPTMSLHPERQTYLELGLRP